MGLDGETESWSLADGLTLPPTEEGLHLGQKGRGGNPSCVGEEGCGARMREWVKEGSNEDKIGLC